MNVFKTYYTYFFVLVILIALFNIFFNLWELPVQEWDEARHGVNAYEMLTNGILSANHYRGQPDYWNLKPPLGTWLIALSFSIFGLNPFGLRFFSAFFGFLTIVITTLYAKRKFGPEVSILSGFILATCFSFIHVHGARTGDFDAILTFLVLLSVITSERARDNKNYLYLTAILFSLAFLLKSFASVMVALVILLSFLLNRMYLKMKIYDYILLPIVSITPIVAWGLARFNFDGTTFFEKMIGYDLVLRGTKTLEGHQSSPLFYLEPIVLKFLPWSILLLVSPFYKLKIIFNRESKIPFRLEYRNEVFRDTTVVIYLLSVMLPALLVSTKTEWYVMPIFPILSIITGWFIFEILRASKEGVVRIPIRSLVTTLIIISIFAEIVIITQTLNPFLRVAQNGSGSIDKFIEETNLQKILVSRYIPKNSTVGFVDIPLSQSYYFLSRVVGNYELVSVSKDDAFSSKGLYVINSRMINNISKEFIIIDSVGDWRLVSNVSFKH
ncbi:MAG: glycosyltransferase family 39 protein [Spirochaetia bacterium]|nr:glycosyltransferase family 39 protein [Spirochaetota bacterium]MCX8096451.1 glycosyltransferase family 39 protein [Spirochaetota bacterium]MDW8112745.1 glycosyltransferase family 39 protein [Spirochaetia bacterium]